jgi:hypothetical protein
MIILLFVKQKLPKNTINLRFLFLYTLIILFKRKNTVFKFLCDIAEIVLKK